MRVNVFEGFRRLKLVLQGLIISAGVFGIIISEPSLFLKLDTSAPDDGWTMSDRPCEAGVDVSEYIFDVPKNLPKEVDSLELCFRSSPLFNEEGDLIPYARKGGYLFADARYSDNVQKYIRERSNNLSISPKLKAEIFNWASEEYWRRWWNDAKSTLILTFSLLAFIEIFARLLAYILRGFSSSR